MFSTATSTTPTTNHNFEKQQFANYDGTTATGNDRSDNDRFIDLRNSGKSNN